ncbi:MAG: beta-N-acetylglucosaminidase domain-containing protein [Alloprevotella sp.]
MKKSYLLAALLCGTLLPTKAQVHYVNPVPQQVETSDEAKSLFAAPQAWQLVTDAARQNGPAALAFKNSGQNVEAQAKYRLLLGLKGDKTVKSVAKQVPEHEEGYYLRITDKEAVIAGYDEQGLFYGVQTLLSILRDGKLQKCEITDYPDVKYRGVVEGFYGRPWSHEDRLRQFDFYARNKMNVYIYGPKDDPYHREHWRTPYPAEEARRIQILAEHAKTCGVNFYWAIHPGLDIKWTDADRDALVAKLEQLYGLGVRSFAVFFDDIWGDGAKADKQADLLNYVDNNFVQKKHDVAPLVLCPTEYNRAWANDEGGYLRTLGDNLNKSIEIMWTGNSVVHCIDKESMEWINSRIARKAYIWWNFPVNDFVRDHILLGPTYGNGLDIAGDLSGFVSNPMQYAESSKVALYSIADYTWNMESYDWEASWNRALEDLLPGQAEALKIVASFNEDLGPNGHGFRREESRRLVPIAKAAAEGDQNAILQLGLQCKQLSIAADILLGDKENPWLIEELRPWLLQMKNVAAYGDNICWMGNSVDKDPNKISPALPLMRFEMLYAQAKSQQKQIYDFEANPANLHEYQTGAKTATRVLLPALQQIFTQAVETYNSRTGAHLDPTAEYMPYALTSTVPQLAQQPITGRGSDVQVERSLEVVTWPADSYLEIKMDRTITLQGLDFDFGTPDTAGDFKLEILRPDGTWTEVGLLHYNAGETVVHTGNELGGMDANAIRLTNKSGKELQRYFKSFRFSKR